MDEGGLLHRAQTMTPSLVQRVFALSSLHSGHPPPRAHQAETCKPTSSGYFRSVRQARRARGSMAVDGPAHGYMHSVHAAVERKQIVCVRHGPLPKLRPPHNKMPHARIREWTRPANGSMQRRTQRTHRIHAVAHCDVEHALHLARQDRQTRHLPERKRGCMRSAGRK